MRAERNGAFNQDNWPSLQFTGRLTIDLKRELVPLLPPGLFVDYTLCVRAGRYGQLSPLVVNLPRSREPLDIVLVGRNTAGQCAKLTLFSVLFVCGLWLLIPFPVLNLEIVDNTFFCPFSDYSYLFLV